MIETDRLLLRRYTYADVDALVDMYSDPVVRRYLGLTTAYGREQAIARVTGSEQDWNEHGQRFLAIVDRRAGRFLGRVMLYDWPQFGETEIGWILNADARGHGYATEAARAFIEWGFANLDVPYVTAMIDPENEPSRRVAERLGMTKLRRDKLEGHAVIVHKLDRP